MRAIRAYPRLRYRNGSPKRVRWDGAHNFRKRGLRIPPAQRHYPASVTLTWRGPAEQVDYRGFEQAFPTTGVTAKGLSWWRMAVKDTRDRERDARKRESIASLPTKNTAKRGTSPRPTGPATRR